MPIIIGTGGTTTGSSGSPTGGTTTPTTTGVSVPTLNPEIDIPTSDLDTTAIDSSSQQEIDERLIPPQLGDGIRRGRQRTFEEDFVNFTTKEVVVTAETTLQATKITATTQAAQPTPVVVSNSQAVRNLENRTFESPKAKADSVRSLQKLQRKCNHSFNPATNRCVLCTKRKDSARFDPLDRSILSSI